MDPEQQHFMFQKLIEASDLGQGFLDLNGKIIYINPALCRMLGETKSENALGKKIGGYYLGDSRKKFLNEILPNVKDKGAWHGELPLKSVEGHIIPTIQDIFLINDDEGNPLCFSNVIEDILERKKEEENFGLTQFSVDHSLINIFWLDKEGRFIYVNEGSSRSLGYTKDELLSMHVWDIDPLMPMECWPGHWEELRKKKILVFEMLHRRKDGSEFPVEIHANYIQRTGENHVFALVRDITESKRDKEVLIESENRFKTLFESANDAIFLIATPWRAIADLIYSQKRFWRNFKNW